MRHSNSDACRNWLLVLIIQIVDTATELHDAEVLISTNDQDLFV